MPPISRYLQVLFYVFALFDAAISCNSSAAEQPSGRNDLYGDPLPPGVVARLGTIRFRNAVSEFKLSPDGTTLAVYPSGWSALVQVCDAKTGRILYTVRGNTVKDSMFSPERGKTAGY